LTMNENIEKKYPTIVTAYYDIHKLQRKFFPNKQFEVLPGKKTFNDFLKFASEFILTLPYPIIIFLDENEDADQIEDFIHKNKKNTSSVSSLNHTYCVYREGFNNTHFYSHLDRLVYLQSKFHIVNGDIRHETPHYIILNNNKFHFMEKAIEKNPFGSSHFIWIDFGINHVAKSPEKIHEWIGKVPDKVKQLCINPYIEKDDRKMFFQFIYHHTAGGLFSGSVSYMKEYIRLFKEKVEEVYSQGWYQIDEAIMTMVQRDNPHLFEYFYGDYEGIIANYDCPVYSFWLIFTGMNKLLSFEGGSNMETKMWCMRILDYLEPYFEKVENQCGEYFYDYINKNILVNYYFYEKKLKDSVLRLIHNKLSLNDENNSDFKAIREIIQLNRNNLSFYVNSETLI
jgi:Bacterial protein of unknown function (HtrL_YibB)